MLYQLQCFQFSTNATARLWNICACSALAMRYMAIKVNSTIVTLTALVGLQVLGTISPWKRVSSSCNMEKQTSLVNKNFKTYCFLPKWERNAKVKMNILNPWCSIKVRDFTGPSVCTRRKVKLDTDMSGWAKSNVSSSWCRLIDWFFN